jgi:hypothetical protein
LLCSTSKQAKSANQASNNTESTANQNKKPFEEVFLAVSLNLDLVRPIVGVTELDGKSYLFS